MPALPFPDERAFLPQISKVTRCCRRRRTRDGAVFAGAHTALEPFGSFLEHSKERSLLPVVQLSPDAGEQLRLVDEEFDERQGTSLRFDCRAGKPSEPFGNFVAFVGRFERRIIARAPRKNRCRKRNQGRLP